ncbi:MAG: CAAD domain-containing protein [Xenococcaceae cyanobacterium MO_188.B29]|nr:CAAD domain-containing protein [Xenococcaceae cyanobacterium MO_188.B29]
MESEAQKTELQATGLNTEVPGMMTTRSSGYAGQQGTEFLDQAKEFLVQLPDDIGKFFSQYQEPIKIILLILAGGVTVKIAFAILDAINDIPLLAPLFELVGIGYTGWFVYRYMLKESTRQELGSELDALKTQVLGKDS